MRKSKFKNFKKAFVAVPVAVAMACTLAATACADNSTSSDNNKNDNEKREDTQVLLNGDFEYFDLPSEGKYEYLIKTPDDWSTTGTSSSAKSGIIGTSKAAWDKIEADDLPQKLDDNNDLKTTDADYADKHVDYNGMQSKDIPYKDMYKALKPLKAFNIEEKDGKYYITVEGDETEVYKADDTNYYYDEEHTQPLYDKTENVIENPGNHYNVTEKDQTVTVDGKNYTVKIDDNDNLYYEVPSETEGEEAEKVFISNVLMVHNYASSHNGITSGYASTSVDLPANTSAEISLWVKTSDMSFDKGVLLNDDQDRGAYIKVAQTVGGNSLDDFKIRAINTEKLAEINAGNAEFTAVSSNGWVQYTVYVNACDFADSTITITLGLGEEGNENFVEGYAFFDDVVVKKFTKNIYDTDEGTFSANRTKITNTTCSLVSDESEKTFSADDYYVNAAKTEDRCSKNFHYLIDLASQGAGDSSYQPIAFTSTNVSAALTVDETDKTKNKYYAAATEQCPNTQGLNAGSSSHTLTLPEGLRGVPRKTSNDLLGVFSATGTDDIIDAAMFGSNSTDYSSPLNEALKSVGALPNAKGNLLLMFSTQGAPYTAKIGDPLSEFQIEKDNYKIVSFWVKTSKNTSATISIIDDKDTDREKVQSLTVDTTDVTVDIDDDNKDIYSGWVQCFFFVKNETEDTQNFTIEFNYGLKDLKSTTAANYKGGFVALANMQVLPFNKEEIFGYTSSGDYAATFDFAEEDDEVTGQFDTPVSTVKDGFGTPSSYTGYNGGSSNVVVTSEARHRYDDPNTNPNAGLLAKKYMQDYIDADPAWLTTLANAFKSTTLATKNAEEMWKELFGSYSTQPLVIVNQIRTLAESAKVTEEQFNADKTKFYTYDAGSHTFKQVQANDEYDKDTIYYSSVNKAMNYGFVSTEKTISANDYAFISVQVKVSAGATAYVYLTDGIEVLDFETPDVSFWYDDEGNVLKSEPKDNETQAEHRANIAYRYRPSDGLYEDNDGTLYANLHSLKEYYTDESKEYFKDDAGQEPISFDDLEVGETYYYENGDIANHYLINSDEATKNNPLFEYFEGKYYYRVNGARGSEVKDFDTSVATPRYDYDNISEKTPYAVKVEGGTEGKTTTVKFFIRTGSNEKKYRLELWSGDRNSSGVDEQGNVLPTASQADSAIIFDYSYYTGSSENFESLRAGYESDIIEQYKDLLATNDKLGEITAKDTTVRDYEELIERLGLTAQAEDIKNAYTAFYYTYSFYDSADYAPFNASTASNGETGYNYDPSSYSETLAYLKHESEDEVLVISDYSTVEQDIATSSIGGDDDDNDVEVSDNGGLSGDAWLLISSIVLVVALLFALLSLLIRNMLKKRKVTAGRGRSKRIDSGEGKRKRYLKWLRISKSEYEDVDIDTGDDK